MMIPVNSTPKPERRRSSLMACEMVNAVPGAHVPSAQFGEILSSRISLHGGVVLNHPAPFVLAEFEDAAEAVNCAISIQEQFAHYNKLHLDEGSISARAGIHFGELILVQGGATGGGVESLKEMLPAIPAGRIYLTRDCYARVRVHLSVKLDPVTSTISGPLPGGGEIFSVDWEAVAENLKASLKRLGEDDLRRSMSITSKLGIVSSKRASPIVMIFVLLFIFIVFKLLKWL
jgi:hypothetical protein